MAIFCLGMALIMVLYLKVCFFLTRCFFQNVYMYNRRQSYKVVVVWIWIFINTYICTEKHRSTFFRFLSHVLETQDMMLKSSNFFLKHFLFSPSSPSAYADKIFMKYLFHRAFKTGFPCLRSGTGNRNVGMGSLKIGHSLCINSNASWGEIVGFITELLMYPNAHTIAAFV